MGNFLGTRGRRVRIAGDIEIQAGPFRIRPASTSCKGCGDAGEDGQIPAQGALTGPG